MKKIILVMLLALSIVLPSNTYASENKIKIYLFRGDTCPHCEEALEYLNEHKDKIEGYELVTYETWENDANSRLLKAVDAKLNITGNDIGSVPLFVVGDKYIMGYKNSSTIDEVLNYAKEIKEDEYKDIVEEAANELKSTESLKFKALGLNDIFPEPNPIVNIIIYSVFGLLIIGFVCMIAFSRKK